MSESVDEETTLEGAHRHRDRGLEAARRGDVVAYLKSVQRALEITKKLWHGPNGDHIEVSRALYALGDAYEANKEFKYELNYKLEALRMFKRLLPVEQEEERKKRHALHVEYLRGVAAAYQNNGDYLSELKYQLEAHKLLTQQQPSALAVANSLDRIGKALSNLGHYKHELKFKLEALVIKTKLFKNNQYNLSIADSLDSVATAFGNNLNYEQQLAYRLKALEIKQNILSINDNDHDHQFDMAKSYLNTALAYKDLNDKENLVLYLKKAIDVYEKRFNNNNKNLDESDDGEELNTDLARCNLALSNQGHESDSRREAVKLERQLLLDDRKDLGVALTELSKAYGHCQDYKSQLQTSVEVLKMFQRLEEGDSFNIVAALNNVGVSYGANNDKGRELYYLLRALKMYLRLYNGDHRDLFKILRNLEECYKKHGDTKNAKQFQNAAKRIYLDIKGQDHCEHYIML